MRNKYKSIICSLLLCSTLSNSYAASDDYVDAYTPGTSSKVGLLKAGLMGIGLMSMAKPVEAQLQSLSVSVINNVKMKECYIGKMDAKNVKPYNNISITQIMDIPFSFNNDINQLRDISLQLSGSFSEYSFNDYTLGVDINTAYLCSMVFTGTLSAKIKFNYENNNCDDCFSMVTYYKSSSNVNYDLTYRENFPPFTIMALFTKVLKNVIDTGSCPQSPTSPTILAPTPMPTIFNPTNRPTQLSPTIPAAPTSPQPPTIIPGAPTVPLKQPTFRPTLRPSTIEPTTTNPTTSTPTTLVPTTRPHHSFPTRPWPPFFPTPWAPDANS